MYDMIRFWTMSISDFLDEYFENKVIKAYQAVAAIIGTALGPMSPGTGLCAAASLHGRRRRQRRRLGLCARRHGLDHQGAAPPRFKAAGGEIRTGSGVDRILVKNGRAVGVVLANGDEVHGKRVVSNMDVKRTFLKHVDERELAGRLREAREELQDPRLFRQAEHRARPRAEIHGPARGRAQHQGRHALHRLDREDGARL